MNRFVINIINTRYCMLAMCSRSLYFSAKLSSASQITIKLNKLQDMCDEYSNNCYCYIHCTWQNSIRDELSHGGVRRTDRAQNGVRESGQLFYSPPTCGTVDI